MLHTLLPALAGYGIHLLRVSSLDPAARAATKAYFHEQVLPVLTPLGVDFERPFPLLATLSLNLAFWIPPAPNEGERRLAIVQVPSRLPRLVRIAGAGPSTFVLLEDLIRAEAAALFPGQTLLEGIAFRLTRDSELDLDDEGDRSYLDALEHELRRRRRGAVVRVEIEDGATEESIARLVQLVGADADDVYRLPGLLDIRSLFALVDLPGFDQLRTTKTHLENHDPENSTALRYLTTLPIRHSPLLVPARSHADEPTSYPERCVRRCRPRVGVRGRVGRGAK